jgi:hypothetical protein
VRFASAYASGLLGQAIAEINRIRFEMTALHDEAHIHCMSATTAPSAATSGDHVSKNAARID